MTRKNKALTNIIRETKKLSNKKECDVIGLRKIKSGSVFDLRGQKFGRLTVKKFSHIYNNGIYFWKCRCDCGKKIVACTGKLRYGHTKSCGCFARDRTSETNKHNLTGKVFGRLKVLSEAKPRNKQVCWKCQCKCGRKKIYSVPAIYLTTGDKKSCGCLNHRKGRESSSYRHDVSLKQRSGNRRYGDERAIKWRNKVFKRDDYTCQLSGIRGGRICAHHIVAWSRSKTLRYRLNNGITILQRLHMLFHKLYGSGYNTRKQFNEFVVRYKSGEFVSKV